MKYFIYDKDEVYQGFKELTEVEREEYEKKHPNNVLVPVLFESDWEGSDQDAFEEEFFDNYYGEDLTL